MMNFYKQAHSGLTSRTKSLREKFSSKRSLSELSFSERQALKSPAILQTTTTTATTTTAPTTTATASTTATADLHHNQCDNRDIAATATTTTTTTTTQLPWHRKSLTSASFRRSHKSSTSISGQQQQQQQQQLPVVINQQQTATTASSGSPKKHSQLASTSNDNNNNNNNDSTNINNNRQHEATSQQRATEESIYFYDNYTTTSAGDAIQTTLDSSATRPKSLHCGRQSDSSEQRAKLNYHHQAGDASGEERPRSVHSKPGDPVSQMQANAPTSSETSALLVSVADDDDTAADHRHHHRHHRQHQQPHQHNQQQTSATSGQYSKSFYVSSTSSSSSQQRCDINSGSAQQNSIQISNDAAAKMQRSPTRARSEKHKRSSSVKTASSRDRRLALERHQQFNNSPGQQNQQQQQQQRNSDSDGDDKRAELQRERQLLLSQQQNQFVHLRAGLDKADNLSSDNSSPFGGGPHYQPSHHQWSCKAPLSSSSSSSVVSNHQHQQPQQSSSSMARSSRAPTGSGHNPSSSATTGAAGASGGGGGASSRRCGVIDIQDNVNAAINKQLSIDPCINLRQQLTGGDLPEFLQGTYNNTVILPSDTGQSYRSALDLNSSLAAITCATDGDVAPLPWQSDAAIQCDLLCAPPLTDAYETTGDIIKTIVGPFRPNNSNLACVNNNTNNNSNNNTQALSAVLTGDTLKRGLNALATTCSQHHLGAPGTVVGSLKKSISNTIDIALDHHAQSCQQYHQLMSAEPAYEYLHNEQDDSCSLYQLNVSNGNSNSITTAANDNSNVSNNNNNNSSNNNNSNNENSDNLQLEPADAPASANEFVYNSKPRRRVYTEGSSSFDKRMGDVTGKNHHSSCSNDHDNQCFNVSQSATINNSSSGAQPSSSSTSKSTSKNPFMLSSDSVMSNNTNTNNTDIANNNNNNNMTCSRMTIGDCIQTNNNSMQNNSSNLLNLTSSASSTISQLAGKISRQSSKKFSSKKNVLQRALSFDCRGYKRLGQQQSIDSVNYNSSNLDNNSNNYNGQQQCDTTMQQTNNRQLSSSTTSNHQRSKTITAKSSQMGRRMGTAQPQVDFHVPLLPYQTMQNVMERQHLPVSAQRKSYTVLQQQQQAADAASVPRQPLKPAPSVPPGGTSGRPATLGDVASSGQQQQQQQRQQSDLPVVNIVQCHSRSNSNANSNSLDMITNQLVGGAHPATDSAGPNVVISDISANSSASSHVKVSGQLSDPIKVASSNNNNNNNNNNSNNRQQQQQQTALSLATVDSTPDYSPSSSQVQSPMSQSRPRPNLTLDLNLDNDDDQEQQSNSSRSQRHLLMVDIPSIKLGDGCSEQHQMMMCLPSPNVHQCNEFGIVKKSPSFRLETGNSSHLSHASSASSTSGCLMAFPAGGGSTGNMTGSRGTGGAGGDFCDGNSNNNNSDNIQMICDTSTTNNSNNNLGLGPNSSELSQSATTLLAKQSGVLMQRRQAMVPPKLPTDINYDDTDKSNDDISTCFDANNDNDTINNNNGTTLQSADRSDAGPPRLPVNDELPQVNIVNDDGDHCTVIGNMDTDHTARPAHADKWGARDNNIANNNNNSNSSRQQQFTANRNAANLYRATSGSHGDLSSASNEATGRQRDYFDMPPSAMGSRPESRLSGDGGVANSNGSSGSGTNLSVMSRRDFQSPGGLTVSSASQTRNRRRSSIAVIPQMQICPGDLLVYSKQLIDRMNQSDNSQYEQQPPYLTVEDSNRKGKNIWSSFKLFDTRSTRARTEFLGGLEDVLASIQPSTFVDEQLSLYKGMTWNEFVEELASRRSSSSYMLAKSSQQQSANNNSNNNQHSDDNNGDNLVDIHSDPRNEAQASQGTGAISRQGSRHGNRQANRRELQSKPKLKRGQTVDSVFRLPLIPTSTVASPRHAPTGRNSGANNGSSNQDNYDNQYCSMAPTPTHKGNNGADGADTPGRVNNGPPATKERAHKTVSSDFILLVSAETSPTGQNTRQSAGTPNANRSLIGSPQRAITECDSNQNLISQSSTFTGDISGQTALTRTAAVSPSADNGKPTSGKQHDTGPAISKPAGPLGRLNTIDAEGSFEADDALDLLSNSPTHMNFRAQQMARQSSLTTITSTVSRAEQKRQRALWDLFQSECTFFYDHLMTLKNVYMEPLKKIQVEGFAMFADPDVLFGNLDELCCGVYDFCKEFLNIIMRTLKTHPEDLNATEILIKLYKKNPKIDQLRGVYHRYTLNYINALTYLETLRRQVEFVEFEKWSSRDLRCKKLQLTDLLVAPVQHIMRVPIILKDIESRTENPRDHEEIRTILAVEEASLRELDDKMRWLKNFERLLEIQKNIYWPNLFEIDPKIYVPEFLKEALSKQPCEKLIVSPRRQIVFEGTISNLDLGKPCDVHMILFDDMLILTRRKKTLTKKASTVCKPNPLSASTKEEGSFKYVVYKQPLSLDRFYVHDVQSVDAQSAGLKNLFLLIVLNRFQQITFVHTFSAQTDELKQTWVYKIKKTAERWKRNFQNSLFRAGGQQQQQQQPQQQSQSNQTNRYNSGTGNDCAPMERDVPMANQYRQQQVTTISNNHHHNQTVITSQPCSLTTAAPRADITQISGTTYKATEQKQQQQQRSMPVGDNLSNDATNTSLLMDTGAHQSSEIENQTAMKQNNIHDATNMSYIKGATINSNKKPVQQVDWASGSDGNRKTGSKPPENATNCVDRNQAIKTMTTTATTGELGSSLPKLLPNEKPPIPKRTFATLVSPVVSIAGSDQTNKPSPTHFIGSDTKSTMDPFAATKNDNSVTGSSNFSSLI